MWDAGYTDYTFGALKSRIEKFRRNAIQTIDG